MISKCANPACSTRFLYLHEGKLFRFEREAKEDTELLLGFDTTLHKHSRGVEFYWLCATCATPAASFLRQDVNDRARAPPLAPDPNEIRDCNPSRQKREFGFLFRPVRLTVRRAAFRRRWVFKS